MDGQGESEKERGRKGRVMEGEEEGNREGKGKRGRGRIGRKGESV